MKINNPYIILFFLVLSHNIAAQNEQTLYMSDYILQSNLTNPAIFPKGRKVIISLPGVFANISSPVSLGQFIVTRNERRILDPWSTQWIDKLNTNFNDMELNVKVLSGAVSFPVGKYLRISAHHQITSNSIFEFSKDAASLVYKGNSAFIGKTASLYNLVSMDARSEFGLGVAYQTGNLSIGARLKAQNGIAGAFTKSNTINLTTDSDNYGLSLETDYKLQTFSAAKDIKNLFLNNGGYSLDLGFSYKYENYEFTGAFLDMVSKVNWKHNARTYSTNGRYDFFGFKNISVEKTTFKTFTDTIKKALDFKDESGGTYLQEINPRIYIGLNRLLSDNLRLGINFFMESKPYGLSTGAMLSANTKLWNFWDIGVSAGSRTGTAKLEIGLSGAVTISKRVQLYALTDNVMSYISPATAKAINGRMGINLLFGKEDTRKRISSKKKKIKKKKFQLKIKKYWYKKKK